jgi:hypothetical protein
VNPDRPLYARAAFGRLLTAALVGSAVASSAAAARADDADAPKPADIAPAPAAVAVVAPVKDKHDPREDPMKTYYFIGLRYRDVVVPKFMIDIFADGGTTVNVPMFGPEFSMHKNHFEYDVSVMYGDYSMNPFLFKGKSDGTESYEIVSSSMKALYFTFELLYAFDIDDAGKYAVLVGGGAGFAPIFGNLYRNQAFPKTNPGNPNVNDVNQWQKCNMPGSPNTVGPNGAEYCDPTNTHYNSYAEPSWANGGSKPFIFPWLSIPQVSFRYRPIHEVQLRADLGFSITGFYFGFSGAYGL